jgi:hypothetical protein
MNHRLPIEARPAKGIVVLLVALSAVLGTQPREARAASEARSAYLKLVFNAEGQLQPTSGCFNVRERRYTGAHWWSTADGTEGIEHTLKKVVAAFKAKDRDSLLKVSDPGSRDPKTFDDQAAAFFQQFSILNVTDIPRSEQVDSLTIFFITFEYEGKVSSAPLVFKKADENQFWFLPERSKSLEYSLAREWFEATSKNAENPDASYCTPDEIAKASYRIPVSSDPAVEAGDRSYLYLAGFPLGEKAPQTELTRRVDATLNTLNKSLAGYDGAAPLAILAGVGAKRLKDWWATADTSERNNYISAVTTQKPFFVFNLSPLVVLYTKGADNVPHVMYFMPDEHGTLLWTNSSYGTTFDRIFKDGALFNAAKSVPPFKSFLIQR